MKTEKLLDLLTILMIASLAAFGSYHLIEHKYVEFIYAALVFIMTIWHYIKAMSRKEKLYQSRINEWRRPTTNENSN